MSFLAVLAGQGKPAWLNAPEPRRPPWRIVAQGGRCCLQWLWGWESGGPLERVGCHALQGSHAGLSCCLQGARTILDLVAFWHLLLHVCNPVIGVATRQCPCLPGTTWSRCHWVRMAPETVVCPDGSFLDGYPCLPRIGAASPRLSIIARRLRLMDGRQCAWEASCMPGREFLVF